jgi:hypothetical protein
MNAVYIIVTLFVFVFVFVLVACVSLRPNWTKEPDSLEREQLPDASHVGSAQIDKDKVLWISVPITTDDGIKADGMYSVKPGDPTYERILEHLGPIKVGEQVAIPPWPSDLVPSDHRQAQGAQREEGS